MDDWKEGATKRRDQRNIKEDIKTKVPSGKDTKKYCKGKVGVPHQLECVKFLDVKKKADRTGPQQRWRILVCKVCGKELDIYYGNNKHKPDWVSL